MGDGLHWHMGAKLKGGTLWCLCDGLNELDRTGDSLRAVAEGGEAGRGQ